jgi:hypothetical protein
MEIWKDINEYEGLYQISNLGRIKSLKRIVNHKKNGIQKWPEKIINYNYNKNGYVAIRLSKNSIIKRFLIHRLVAINFLTNFNNYNEVNHINSIKTDNKVENLEWCTRKHNQQHMSKLINNSNQIVINKLNGIFHYSIKEASECYNYNYSVLRDMLNNKMINKSHLIKSFSI